MHSMQSEAIFAALAGDWLLQRTITNNNGAEGSWSFEGQATFEAQAHAAYTYREAGQLNTGKGLLTAQRRYVFRYAADAQAIVVHHGNDGSLLHTLCSDARGTAVHRHTCGGDVYDVTYAFAGLEAEHPMFSSTYRVRGPHKDYVMHSIFARG